MFEKDKRRTNHVVSLRFLFKKKSSLMRRVCSKSTKCIFCWFVPNCLKQNLHFSNAVKTVEITDLSLSGLTLLCYEVQTLTMNGFTEFKFSVNFHGYLKFKSGM